MPDIQHPKCDHPKCGAKMQRIYKRNHSAFIPCGWMCTDCGLFKKIGWMSLFARNLAVNIN